MLKNISKITSKEFANEVMEQFFIDFPEIQYRLAKDANVSEMWLTHYSPSLTYPEEYMGDVRAIFENAKAGKDGMSVELEFPEK